MKGIVFFGIGLTLRDGNREYFYRALDRNFPGLKEKYVRNFGQKYEAESPNSSFLIERLKRVCMENEIMLGADSIFKKKLWDIGFLKTWSKGIMKELDFLNKWIRRF